MNHEHQAALYEWLDHVKNNKERMNVILDTLSCPSGFYSSRNALAEVGKEVTPKELQQFREMVKEALEILEKNNDKG